MKPIKLIARINWLEWADVRETSLTKEQVLLITFGENEIGRLGYTLSTMSGNRHLDLCVEEDEAEDVADEPHVGGGRARQESLLACYSNPRNMELISPIYSSSLEHVNIWMQVQPC